MKRRQFLQGTVVASVSLLGCPTVARAVQRDPRFVLVILRGGLEFSATHALCW